ncbi:MAG: hypothetical protein ACKOW8_11090, partial [Flavobacteriales bacterium]
MKLLVFLLMFSLGALAMIAQPPAQRINPVSAASTSHSFFTQRSEWTEQELMRDAHHAYWKHADGRIMIENCEKPIHFLKNNAWQRIDARSVCNNGGWEATQQPHPVRINSNGSFSLDFQQAFEMQLGSNCSMNEVHLRFNCSPTDAGSFFAKSQLPGVSKEIKTYENA